jgi:hypothetical protein
MKRTDKLPRDPSQRAKMIVDLTTGNAPEPEPERGKNPAAVALGRLGASKGGIARRDKLSPKKRKEIAQKAARSRWNKPSE